MPTDQPGINGGSAADRPAITGRSSAGYRSAVTRSPAARLDGRSPTGKRIRDLYAALTERLNQPADIMVQADIMALVELKVAAEAARLRLLEGKDQNTNGLVRLENLVRRAEARVGLEAGAGTKVDPPDWRDLLPDDEEDEEQPDAADVTTEGGAP
jgi:hypothetical protein